MREIIIVLRNTHIPKEAPEGFQNYRCGSRENIDEKLRPAIRYFANTEGNIGCKDTASVPKRYTGIIYGQWVRLRTVHRVYAPARCFRLNNCFCMFSSERERWAWPHTKTTENEEKNTFPAAGKWLGVDRFSSIQERIDVGRANYGIKLFTESMYWPQHRFYISRFHGDWNMHEEM